ncbi:MAG: hypothetical protein HQ546_01925, partial [Planctomycetes bacterium]|nr:hypothetical protein [Planctomycetota bacterium]
SLAGVLNRELAGTEDADEVAAWLAVLEGLRILIVHAGGDSKRLPAYGVSGKLFVPVPGESDSAVPATLFDRQCPIYLALPAPAGGAGQVVIAAGDVLLSFDPRVVRFAAEGLTGLGTTVKPEQASGHGVYCADAEGRVKFFLQKPSPQQQSAVGAVDPYGQTVVDIGVMSFDAVTAVTLLKAAEVGSDANGRLGWSGQMGHVIATMGLDFYREICCAPGTQMTARNYVANARGAGSMWDEAVLIRWFEALREIPFRLQVLDRCGFLHLGTTRELIASGLDLLRTDRGVSRPHECVCINTEITAGGKISGGDSWVEGCRIRHELALAGQNAIIGADIDEPMALGPGVCVDITPGADRTGKAVWFVKCYGIDDSFKDTAEQGATLCNKPVHDWLHAMEAEPDAVWDRTVPADRRTVWDARVFPAVKSHADYQKWLWVVDPTGAGAEQKRSWLAAERYSLAEIARLTDADAFSARRRSIYLQAIRRSFRRLFRQDSAFSALELAATLATAQNRSDWVIALLEEARWHDDFSRNNTWTGDFVFSRIVHTIGSAVAELPCEENATVEEVLPGLVGGLDPAMKGWLESSGIGIDPTNTVMDWARCVRAAAFSRLGKAIISSGRTRPGPPKNSLRRDEIVWGRAPARLDVGGGWSDTPPYCLEYGGCVLNAAVNLNGQPPIHCYARVINEPVIRVGSIDLGAKIEITDLADLLDYHTATGEFALAKAALALSGFSPESAAWTKGISLAQMLERFGGGLELTTLAAIPKGSGLGTSSIVGAVVLATLNRVMGRSLTQAELFHGVLRLEQELTTGGGWQDQIGGVVSGVKIITTEPGLVPNPSIQYLPSDVFDPITNGGSTLLYYTGITRLAKNILQQVVGRYLDRNRATMATLRQIHALPARVADALGRKDLRAFGELVETAWELNKQLDPGSTNDQVETLLTRISSHVYGAKLLGAGGGGFLLMVCKSTEDARAVREALQADPPNELARFFDFQISREGLVVTVC